VVTTESTIAPRSCGMAQIALSCGYYVTRAVGDGRIAGSSAFFEQGRVQSLKSKLEGKRFKCFSDITQAHCKLSKLCEI
jgi:hypothetical protein